MHNRTITGSHMLTSTTYSGLRDVPLLIYMILIVIVKSEIDVQVKSK